MMLIISKTAFFYIGREKNLQYFLQYHLLYHMQRFCLFVCLLSSLEPTLAPQMREPDQCAFPEIKCVQRIEGNFL